VHVVHHLPHDVGDGSRALPRSIVAEVKPSPSVNPESFTVTSNADLDGVGSLHVDAHADVDETKSTQLEDIVIDSRWRAGRCRPRRHHDRRRRHPAEPGVVTPSSAGAGRFPALILRGLNQLRPSEGEVVGVCLRRAVRPPGATLDGVVRLPLNEPVLDYAPG
jgi:hypothetical protein